MNTTEDDIYWFLRNLFTMLDVFNTHCYFIEVIKIFVVILRMYKISSGLLKKCHSVSKKQMSVVVDENRSYYIK